MPLLSAFLLVAVALAPRPAPAGASPAEIRDTLQLNFVISRAADDSAGVDLRLDFSAAPGRRTPIMLPDEWAGRNDLYSGILDLRSTTAGATLVPDSVPSRPWVAAPPGTPVSLSWRLRADTAPPDPESHNFSDIRPHWAQLIGQDALVLPALPLDTPVHATFRFVGLPPGTAVATSFGSGAAPGAATVEMRGQLGDLQAAVYTFGSDPASVRRYPVPVSAGTLTVAVRGTLRIPDTAFVRALERIVSAERAFWGGRSPERYLVTIGPAPRGSMGGVRLNGAFVAVIDSTVQMNTGVAATFAHELMHEWIGGALHPPDSLPDRELTWFTEGFTEYLSHRVLWQTGILSDSAYVAVLGAALREQALSPASDMPWDSVVTAFWTSGDIKRQAYLRGWILGLRLEAVGRASPARPISLTAALKELLPPDGDLAVTRQRLEAAFARVVGRRGARAEIDSALAGGPLTIPASLFGGCVDVETEPGHPWEPGFDVQGSLRARTVQGVKPGTAAGRAGLRDGMPIRGASIYFGDPTKEIRLKVAGDSAERTIQLISR